MAAFAFAFLVARVSYASTFEQVPLQLAGRVIPRLTETYTLSDPDIELRVFDRVKTGGAFFVTDDDGTQRKVGVFVDPAWSRIVYSAEGEPIRASDGYGTGATQLAHPASIDISPSGKLFIADTDNGRVVMYSYTKFVGAYTAWYFVQQFILPGGAEFSTPEEVLWDDNGTPGAEGDDVLWVLDAIHRRLAAYHIVWGGSSYTYQPYLSVSLDGFPGTVHPAHPACIVKGRQSSDGTARGSANTTVLYLFDSQADKFFCYDVPRQSGFLGGTAAYASVAVSVYPNPAPGVNFDDICADPWGNLIAVSSWSSKLYKMSPGLSLLEEFGSMGDGPIGSGQYHSPTGISLDKRRNADGSAELLRTGSISEFWGVSSGIQGVSLGLSVRDVAVTLPSGQVGASVDWFSTDNARTTIQVLGPDGQVVRTLAADSVVAAGAHSITWDGRRDNGAVAAPCASMQIRVAATGLYAAPASATVLQPLYYKPRISYNLTVRSSAGGAQVVYGGEAYSVPTAGVAFPCSLCVSKVLSVVPSQSVSGTRYCYDRWSDGTSRIHSVSLTQDATDTLFLTAGPGPTFIQPGGTIVNEACDCKSPYIFLGNGGLTKSADWDTFRTQGTVTFRFPHATGGQTRAQLGVAAPFVGSGVKFETVDSSATQSTNLWEGISLAGGGTFDCDGCTITNANVGISAPLSAPARALRLRRSYIDYSKTNDIAVAIDTVGAVPVSLFKNRFNATSAIVLTVGGSVLTPHASAVIDSNVFASPGGSNGALRVFGAWSGYINRNTFYVPSSGNRGVQLERYVNGSYNLGWPRFELHQNKFLIEAGSTRYALYAPKSDPFTINAENNDWGGAYNAASNDQVIFDYIDDPSRALVDYDPYIIPAGGGGGGGCPFVLSQGPNGFEVENSILGQSELLSTPSTYVRDAVVLRHVAWTKEPVRLRIAELESEVDEIDYAALGVVKVEEGEEVGIDTEGAPVVFRRSATAARPTRWTGRSQPFVSPIAPVDAYRGEPGDSLELHLGTGSGSVVVRGGRVAISMVPKPQGSPTKPGGPAGVTVQVSYDSEGGTWTSIPAVFPREAWTTQVLPLGSTDGRIPSRVRIVWNSRHTLGWVGLVDARPADVIAVTAPRGAHHSSGHDVLAGLSREDGQTIRVLPGEYLDLEFPSPQYDPNARLVFLTRGRYTHLGSGSPEVPAVAYLAQNRPNPFNPSTEIRFGLPVATRTSLRIFGVSGRLITTLVDGVLPGGNHAILWDGRDSGGRSVSSGVYFYQIDAGDFRERRRMVILR